MAITTLFCDLGGVLLTNGWDHKSRNKAAESFGFDFKDFDSRHQLLFGDYETGKITLDDYLTHALFYQPRSFTMGAFKKFMYAQSAPYEDMINFVKNLKRDHSLKVVIVSNEGRDLTAHRLASFGLKEIGDFFIVSCFVGVRKPDRRIYHMALDMSQSRAEESVYLDDRQLFVELAQEMGIFSICHKDLATTKLALEQKMGKITAKR
jgi:putative hydrolase of the HAD superfamily